MGPNLDRRQASFLASTFWLQPSHRPITTLHLYPHLGDHFQHISTPSTLHKLPLTKTSARILSKGKIKKKSRAPSSLFTPAAKRNNQK